MNAIADTTLVRVGINLRGLVSVHMGMDSRHIERRYIPYQKSLVKYLRENINTSYIYLRKELTEVLITTGEDKWDVFKKPSALYTKKHIG